VKILHLDFETKSPERLDKEENVGVNKYAIHPDAEILMCAVSWDDSDEILLWVNPKYRMEGMLGTDNARVLAMVAEADLIYAHGATFERGVSWAMGERYGFILPIEKMRCTMAMARTAGLPPSLEMLAEALDIEHKKNTRGKALIKIFCVLQKNGTFISPHDRPAEWVEFGGYCKQDVRAEKGVYRELKQFDLKGAPLQTFLFDLRMNERGIPVNVVALKNAERIINAVQAGSTIEFNKLTNLNPTQNAKVKALLGMPNLQAETVEAEIVALKQSVILDGRTATLDPSQWTTAERRLRILKLYQNLSYAAIAKIAAMIRCVCPDGRVRGCHTFYGTGPGRWSARLIQPQNFKKTPVWMRPIMHEVYKRVCEGWDAKKLSLVYGEPLELLSGIIRHFIHGQFEMLDGDYSGIQARVILWLAGQWDILKMMEEGRDMYKFTAAPIYDGTPEAMDSDQREVGKRVFLGCQFQMGGDTFKRTCEEQYGLILPLALCEKGVQVYRKLCPEVVKYWKVLQNDAMAAIASPGTPCGLFLMQTVGKVPFLLFKLPSGRHIAYPHPSVEWESYIGKDYETGQPVRRKRQQITYWGQLPLSQQWGRIKLYGGKLAENITMGVEADIMANGSLEAEKRGMEPFTLVHDQSLAERNRQQTLDEYAAALSSKPDWARTLPIKIDVKFNPYFSK
jgi:DNA polymerase